MAAAASPAPLVLMRNIRKSFGTVEVLHGVDFDVLPGEVHVLAGENGAGKSTLIRILSGVHYDYSGDIAVEGRPLRLAHPREAVRAGIATTHQELSLVPTMSVAEIVKRREPAAIPGKLYAGRAGALRNLRRASLSVAEPRPLDPPAERPRQRTPAVTEVT